MPVSLTNRERAHLKGRAHALEPRVQVGQAGLTDAVVAEIDRALTAHELIKVKILADRDARDEIAAAIGTRTDAAIVQQVGKVVVLWRPKPDEPPATGAIMPQRPPSFGDDPHTGSPPSDAPTGRRIRINMAKICAWCRRVQMPDGTWQPGRRATDATMPTHGICPDCSQRPDIAEF